MKKAFKFGLLSNEQIFLDMLTDRNNSSHIYSKEEPEEIYQRIKNDYVFEFEKVIMELKNRI